MRLSIVKNLVLVALFAFGTARAQEATITFPGPPSVDKARPLFEKAVADNIEFLTNLWDTGLNSAVVVSGVEGKITALGPFFSQLAPYIGDEVKERIRAGKTNSEIKSHWETRVRELQEFGFRAHVLADAQFYARKLFANTKSVEFDDLTLECVEKGVPTTAVEEVWDAARYRLIQRVQAWFLENDWATRKEMETAGLMRLLSDDEVKRFVFQTRVPGIIAKLQEHQYSAFYFMAAGRSIPVDQDPVPFHNRMKHILMSQLEELETEFPGMLNFDQIYEDLKILADKAMANYKAWYDAQEPPITTPWAKMRKSLRGVAEWGYYITVGNAVTYSEAVKGLFNGEGFASGFEKGGQFIHETRSALHRHGGGSVLGGDDEFASQPGAARYYRYYLMPVVAVGEVIQATLELVEEGYVRSVMAINDLSREEYEHHLKSDPYFKAGKAFFYVGEACIGMALVVSSGGAGLSAKGLSNGALWKAQLGLTVKPLAVSLGMGLVFSTGQEMYTAGTPDGKFSVGRLLANTGKGAVGTLVFMGGIGKLTQVMALKGASQAKTMLVANGIDVVEGSADIPQTIIMAYDSHNALQYMGTALVALGNIWDSGDAVFSVGTTAYRNAAAQRAIEAIEGKEGAAQTLQEKPNTEADARIAVVVSLVKRDLTTAQQTLVKELSAVDAGTKAKLTEAGFTDAESAEVLNFLVSLEDLKAKQPDAV